MADNHLYKHVFHFRRLPLADNLCRGCRYGCRLCLFASLFLALLFPFAAYEFIHRAYKCALVDTETVGAIAEIGGADYLIGNYRDAFYDTADCLGTFYRVGDAFQQKVGLELDKVCLVLFDVFTKLFRAMFPCEAVRIVTIGQKHHFHIHALGKQHVDTSYRGVYAGCVAVVKNSNI